MTALITIQMINLLLKISKIKIKGKKLLILWWSKWIKANVYIHYLLEKKFDVLDTGFAFSQEENVEIGEMKRYRF